MAAADGITYGRAARLRVALADQAAEIADSARGLVPTYADEYANGGEMIEAAARLAAEARELLTLAVAYERRRGVSWEAVGEALGISRQSAHTRFAEDDKRLTDAVTECWLTGDDPRFPGLPEGAADPAGVADRLDRWVTRHQEGADPLAHRPADDPARDHPVSAGLPPMDTLEHSTLVTAGATLVRERYGVVPDDPTRHDEETRALEVGLARRKVELYERMMLDGTSRRGSVWNDPDQIADLLAGARARLAELEGPGELPPGVTPLRRPQRPGSDGQ